MNQTQGDRGAIFDLENAGPESGPPERYVGASRRRQNLLLVETGSLGIKTHKTCAQTLTLPLSSCVTSGELLNLSVPVLTSGRGWLKDEMSLYM